MLRGFRCVHIFYLKRVVVNQRNVKMNKKVSRSKKIRINFDFLTSHV